MNMTPMISFYKQMLPVWRAQSTATRLILFAVLVLLLPQQAKAGPEDILGGVFDKITGVPFAATMLPIIRSGEQTSQSPEVLDARLSAVEALLRDMEPRLRQVEERLRDLQNEVVKVSNINRLRELQRIRFDIAEINAELRTKPTDPGRRSVLEFRARQQADLIKNNVDFDIWKWSDIRTADQSIRTRFLVYPSFELYALAITTWFDAIELNSGDRPQSVVTNSGAFLREHAAFLEARISFRDLVDEPVALPEHLRTAAFCRLEAVDRFSNSAGDCVFASVCVDTMADTNVETDRQTLTMQPAEAGVLCTFNPNQALGLKGEAELHNAYGAELMAALANDLGQLSHRGSRGKPFVGGEFAKFNMTQIFSVQLHSPLLAPRGAASGAVPAIPKCIPILGGPGGCSFGVKLSEETAWRIASMEIPAAPGERLVMIKQNVSNLCLDVKDSVATPKAAVILFACNGTASQIWNMGGVVGGVPGQFTLEAHKSGMCATVVPAIPPGVLVQPDRPLFLQSCDGGELQKFSPTDGTPIPPVK
jgi:hypothetical protein